MKHKPKDEPNETSQLLQMGPWMCTWAIVGVSLGQRRTQIAVVEGMSLLYVSARVANNGLDLLLPQEEEKPLKHPNCEL